jgi:hypothetical protein
MSEGSIFGPIIFIIYKHLPINIQGAQTLQSACDINILINAENENVLNQKISRIVKALETS